MLTTEQENRLARTMQRAFPLSSRPYDVLARQIDASPGNVLERVQRWRDEGLLREISAILEGSALGYDSALVAGEVTEEDLPRVAAIVNEHPTITHNYRREHRYNLWFTLAVPREMGIEATLDRLCAATGLAELHPLRRTDTFKIGVNFDLERRLSLTESHALTAAAEVRPSALDVRLFRALQTPLAIEERPFQRVAARAEVSEDEVLAFAARHLGGAMRRFVATFHHRRLGVHGNGMAVWNVPEARHGAIGRILAGAPEVSHCYARNAIAGFPYTVYSMIHGPDEAAVEQIVQRLSGETGIDDYLILFSSHEYKKCRLRYFLPELDAWWESHPATEAA